MLIEPARRSLLEAAEGPLGDFVVLNYEFIESQPSAGFKELMFPTWEFTKASLSRYRMEKKNALVFYQVWRNRYA